MKDIMLDDDGDIVVEGGDLAYVTGDELIAQKIKTVLGTKVGEWLYDTDEGLDFDAFFDKDTTRGRMQDAIQKALMSINEGYTLEAFDYTTEERVLYVRVAVGAMDAVETYVEV